MAESTRAIKFTSGPEELSDQQWWHDLGQHSGSAVLSRVTGAQPREGTIVQSNCVIRRFKLLLDDQEHASVVLKQVDLAQNSYRDEEHRSRSRRSYQVERAFYAHVAPLLRERGVTLPAVLASAWGGDCMQGVAVLEDLGSLPGDPSIADERAEHGRSPLQRLALDEADTRRALAWLAAFHAACWAPPDEETQAVPAAQQRLHDLAREHLWPDGGYWSFEKRQADLPRMEEQWRRWQAALLPPGGPGGDAAAAAGVPELAAGLQAAAPGLATRLTALGATSGRTVLHGDFKTANLFFRPTADGGGVAVCPCDFQWAGTGVCMQDVAYLLWTSVAPAVVAAREEALLEFYRGELRRELAAAGVQRALTDGDLREQYEVAFLDYVRFLVGSMWGACTEASFAEKAGDINQGMHKRDREHQMRMVLRAAELLRRHSATLSHVATA